MFEKHSQNAPGLVQAFRLVCATCRESFRELVLTDSGRVRWNRIENLVEESSKSVGYDQSQLWKVADWIFGDPGKGVRKPVAAELARLIDSAVAGPAPVFAMHTSIATTCGPHAFKSTTASYQSAMITSGVPGWGWLLKLPPGFNRLIDTLCSIDHPGFLQHHEQALAYNLLRFRHQDQLRSHS